MALYSLQLLLNQPVMALAPKEVLIGGMILGGMLAVIAGLGIFGSWSDGNKPALVGYMVLILVMLGISSMGLAVLGREAKAAELSKLLENLWNSAPDSVAYQLQSWGQCCGFHNATDRVQLPCTQYYPEVGCLEPMAWQYKKTLTNTILPLVILLGGELAALALSAILLVAIWREKRIQRATSHKKSFDTWQKAVFQ